MKNTSIIFAGLMVIALICTVGTAAASDSVSPADTTTPAASDTSAIVEPEDIPQYDGPIGADSPLYGLKLAWEDLDESFTTNESERVDKQMNHARLRLSEVRRELAENRTDSAQQAIDLYWQKVNMTQMTLAYFGSNQTGLVHAQEMHEKHQMVLEDLMLSHPNNTGLARAYNNSLRLEQKFEEKTQLRFEKIMEKNNQTIFKAYRLEVREENRAGNGTGNDKGKTVRNEERENSQGDVTAAKQHTNGNGQKTNGNGHQNSEDTGHGKTTPSVTVSPQETTPSEGATTSDQGVHGNDAGKGNGNTNNGDKGNSTGKK
jgi:hypothetical protein